MSKLSNKMSIGHEDTVNVDLHWNNSIFFGSFANLSHALKSCFSGAGILDVGLVSFDSQGHAWVPSEDFQLYSD